jgi:clan AA aspartic protease
MGLTHVTVRLEPLTRTGAAWEADFLVDTGAIDCMAPADALAGIGISEEGRNIYQLANGVLEEYPFGFARVSFMGSDTVSKVVLGPSGIEPILGVVALESVGIVVDPVSKTLRQLPAKPLKPAKPLRQVTRNGEAE